MTLPDFTLLRPGWLLGLLPAVFLLWRSLRSSGQGRAAWEKIVDAHLLPYVIEGTDPGTRRRGLVLLTIGWIAAVVALAGPSVDFPSAGSYRSAGIRVLVVDLATARSGAAGREESLERIKFKLLQLLKALPPGQTALVVYAGEPYVVVPPTEDIETIARFVPELAPDAVPVPGNRPERALTLASRLLERSNLKRRDVIWITGERSLPPELPGVRLSVLHTAGADTQELAAAVVRSGGRYVAMTADDGDTRLLAATLAGETAWEKTTQSDGRQMTDLGYWAMLLILPLAALAFRQGVLTVLIVPLLLFGLLNSPPAEAADFPLGAALADYRAWKQLQAGQPSAAAKAFADRRWQAVAHYRAGEYDRAAKTLANQEDADSLYNRGNALAKQERLADALAVYNLALALRPGDEDIRHNRDLVEALLKQQNDRTGGKKPPPRGGGQPPPAGPARADDTAEKEASRLAEQWLRRLPDEPGTLLRRKLLLEHQKRLAGEVPKPW